MNAAATRRLPVPDTYSFHGGVVLSKQEVHGGGTELCQPFDGQVLLVVPPVQHDLLRLRVQMKRRLPPRQQVRFGCMPSITPRSCLVDDIQDVGLELLRAVSSHLGATYNRAVKM